MSETIRLSGFKELDSALERLSKAAGKGVLRRAGKTALEPIADAARSMAPNDPNTGGFDLVKSITVGTKLSKRQQGLHRKTVRDDKASVEVFVGAGPLPQAHLQEFGTIKHAPQPFMRPAWEAGKMKVLEDLKKELWAEVEKAAARAARKAARR